MTKYLLFALLLIFGIPALAQEAEDEIPETRVLPEIRRHEMGIMTHLPYEADDINMVGAQYKIWKDEHKALRFIAAYGDYSTSDKSLINITNDMLFEKHTRTNVDLAIIGAGIEMQRQFYKKVYLFAAAELRGGYGSGQEEEWLSVRSNNGAEQITPRPFFTNKVKMVYAAAAPSIGAKIQSRRISVGLELMPVQATFRNLDYLMGGDIASLDFNAAIFNQRFFVNYRF